MRTGFQGPHQRTVGAQGPAARRWGRRGWPESKELPGRAPQGQPRAPRPAASSPARGRRAPS